MALPGVILLPSLARHSGALQADCDWHCLGANSTVFNDGGFRWAILGGEAKLNLPGFTLSVGLVLWLFVSGIWYFRKTERSFADVI